MKELTDEMVIQSYNSMVASMEWKKRLGYVNMEELYKHLRKNHIKSLRVAQFQEYMMNFWQRKCPDEFSFARGSGVRSEVNRYAFCVKGMLGGLYYYMRKVDVR